MLLLYDFEAVGKVQFPGYLTVLGDLKLQCSQVAPLNLQQRLVVIDLLDQLFFIHRFYHLLSVREASSARMPKPISLARSHVQTLLCLR